MLLHSWGDFLVAAQHLELSVCRLVELVNVCFITSLNGASLFCIILCPFAQVTGNSDLTFNKYHMYSLPPLRSSFSLQVNSCFFKIFCHPYFTGFPFPSIDEISTTCPGLVGLCFSSLCWLLFQFSSSRFFNEFGVLLEKLELKNFMSPVGEFFVISLSFLSIFMKIFFQPAWKGWDFIFFTNSFLWQY